MAVILSVSLRPWPRTSFDCDVDVATRREPRGDEDAATATNGLPRDLEGIS